MKQSIQAYVAEHIDELFDLLKDLCSIPAPSHHEEKRAEFCRAWLEAAGARSVYIDDAKNVVFPYGCENSNEISVFFAHTDTVFPDTEPMPLVDDGENLRCPGICDDTANLAVLLMTAKFLLEQKIIPPHGILFVCNSCEEGLGNLKGARQIFADYAGRVKQFVTFDGHFQDLADRCVGSHRYEVELRTEGGHSYEDFGNCNAIAELSRLITEIYAIDVPTVGNSKTTYNVGIIEGGTSVNTIAQSAKMLCEYRSDNEDCLAVMQQNFETIFANAKARGLDVTVKKIGDRPCMGKVDLEKIDQMASIATEIITRNMGISVGRVPMSTDANIPLSLGIPSICLGVCEGGGMHTREEWLVKKSYHLGLLVGIETVIALTKENN
ncbi:MAG: M20/M25/M40 family metallo-hydrolase [Clostridia bacterium]|nr:M20/M25/M40 family metallo-hydrolase [Clostridia bacterium]